MFGAEVKYRRQTTVYVEPSAISPLAEKCNGIPDLVFVAKYLSSLPSAKLVIGQHETHIQPPQSSDPFHVLSGHTDFAGIVAQMYSENNSRGNPGKNGEITVDDLLTMGKITLKAPKV